MALAGGGLAGCPQSLAMPIIKSIEQTIAVVDLRNQDVLFWNSVTGNGSDLQDSGQLKNTVLKLLAGLPPIPQGTLHQ